MSGGLDLVAKSTEGLNNQLKSQSDVNVRIRRPRTFYGNYSIIKPYNNSHAFWISILRSNCKFEIDFDQICEVF